MSADSVQRIDEAAGDWFARRESGEWTPEDQARLDEWLAESPLHRVAYLRIEHAWERAERLAALRTADGSVPAPGDLLSPFFSKSSPAPLPSLPGGGDALGEGRAEAREGSPGRWWLWRHRKLAWGLAAGLAAALALGVAWLIWPQTSVYRTPVGGVETIPLADGSTVVLNTDSAVALKFTATERRVELRRGEAFFEVAKDPGRPFVVQAGDRRVVAVGTQFSVRREGGDNDVQVVVTEGTVRMETGRAADVSRPEPGASAQAAGSGAVLVPAGTIAQATGTDVLLQKTPVPVAEESLSWRQGVLVFRDLTLAQAAAEFNRYNARQIVIQDPKVAGMTIAGSFRATNVDAFVRLLEKGYPVRSDSEDDKVLISAR